MKDFVRVISVEFRGLKLISPEGLKTRPTLDRVKEAVFSMLMPYITDADVFDVFAGSGAMGIEALSRGASTAVFTDCDRDAIKCINQNIASAKAGDKSSVVHTDALEYLKKCNEKFDLIFLDPPYYKGLYTSVLKSISEKDILKRNGLIIAEWDFENGFTDDLSEFEVFKQKKYGRVCITVLKRG